MTPEQFEAQRLAAWDAALVENDERMANDLRAARFPGGAGAHWPHVHIRDHSYEMQISPDQGGNYGVQTAFHWRGGLVFSRLKCKCVAITSWVPSWRSGIRHWDVTKVAIITPDEWASIMCGVSDKGETGERWEAARLFYGAGESSP